jgi:hypothetical protein
MSSCAKRRWKVDTISLSGSKKTEQQSEFDLKLAELKAARANINTMWLTCTNSDKTYHAPSSSLSEEHQHNPWSSRTVG